VSHKAKTEPPVFKYVDPDSPLGTYVTRAAYFLYRRRVNQERARVHELRDAKQDIYLIHLEAGAHDPSDALASRAVKRKPHNNPIIFSLNEPLFGTDGLIGEWVELESVEEVHFTERIHEQDEARAILADLHQSQYGPMVRAFETFWEEGRALDSAQRQRRRRLRKAFPELTRQFQSRYRKPKR
jgi:hypothetical protein